MIYEHERPINMKRDEPIILAIKEGITEDVQFVFIPTLDGDPLDPADYQFDTFTNYVVFGNTHVHKEYTATLSQGKIYVTFPGEDIQDVQRSYGEIIVTRSSDGAKAALFKYTLVVYSKAKPNEIHKFGLGNELLGNTKLDFEEVLNKNGL